jgi:hypothetical protein
MKARRNIKVRLCASILALIALPLATVSAQDSGGVEASYHGQMGYGTGDGMLEKWCALPNFSYLQEEGITGWTNRKCSNCHVFDATWDPNDDDAVANCNTSSCHKEGTTPGADDDEVTVAGCMYCHTKDKAKRGVAFTIENDVHIAAGFLCQDCHWKVDDGVSDHQFLKGTAMDTTEQTMMGLMSCTSACHYENGEEPGHSSQPHDGTDRGIALNDHTAKVACETCHTGLRPNKALARRQWNVFTSDVKPVPLTTWREPGWLPEHKWYDNTGPGASGDNHLPILGYTERRGADDAKIYPFNAVTVDWFVRTKQSDYDDIIIVPDVFKADENGDGTVTVDEMRLSYRHATLKTADMNFSISHSVLPANEAFVCKDCHSRLGWVLNWEQLGYPGDPTKTTVDEKPKKPKK